MPAQFPPEMLRVFREMAEVVYTDESHAAVHQRICQAAVELIDGCDHASLMIRRHGRVTTLSASDEVAQQCDDLEQELGEGPCLDAMDDDKPAQHLCADLGDGGDCEWPTLAARMQTDLGVKGMGGFRLHHDGEKVGSLNVYSDTAGALTQSSLDQASLLTSFASVALAALDRGQQASTLREGLQSNREIGKAIGLLMASHGVDSDEAFSLLSRVSQEMNLKVAEVAAQLVARHGAQSA